jgi:hypothetical protein
MKCTDKGWLTAAWVAIAAASAFSLYKVSRTSEIDLTIGQRVRDLDEAEHRRSPGNPQPLLPVVPDRPIPSRAGFITPDEGSTRFHPKFVGIAVPPKDRCILVLPVPVMENATADLDGASITWRTQQEEVEHKPWMIPKAAAPTGFIVMRESQLGQPERIAELGPADRSFRDLSTKPRKTYNYWVVLKGLETDRSNNDGTLLPVTHQADRPVSAQTPAAERLKLLGGDKTHAVLRVESYDRAKKAWVGRTVLTASGEKVDGTAWSVQGLHFDEFTLVADVTDDDGVVRVLSTRN